MHNKTNNLELPLLVRLYPWSGHHKIERFLQVLCNHNIKFSVPLCRGNVLLSCLYTIDIILECVSMGGLFKSFSLLRHLWRVYYFQSKDRPSAHLMS